MSRSRSLLGGLVTAAAAGLTLAGCHSGAAALGAGSTPAAGSSSPAVSTGSGASSAPTVSGSTGQQATTSGLGTVTFFPATVGDRWVYSLDQDGRKGTTTEKVTKVLPVATGSQVTLAATTSNPAGTSAVSWIVHPDGSIGMPTVAAGAGGTFKIESGGLAWPSAAQLASGKQFSEKMVAGGEASGTKITETVNAVFKGEGTQTVTVPAGTYTATVMEEVETAKILGQNTTFDVKTWLVAGVGPVKSLTSGLLNQTEELTSFTKG